MPSHFGQCTHAVLCITECCCLLPYTLGKLCIGQILVWATHVFQETCAAFVGTTGMADDESGMSSDDEELPVGELCA